MVIYSGFTYKKMLIFHSYVSLHMAIEMVDLPIKNDDVP